jgi:uncharacterized protein YciI
MRTLFAVVRTRGPTWDAANPMRAQPQWTEHAAFMENLAAGGFIVLGGPVGEGGEGPDFLFAVAAADEREIRSTLERDLWSRSGMLEVRSIRPWTILLESGSG